KRRGPPFLRSDGRAGRCFRRLRRARGGRKTRRRCPDISGKRRLRLACAPCPTDRTRGPDCRPRPTRPSRSEGRPPVTVEVHGDDRLAARLEELLGPRHPVAAAAVVRPSGTVVACRGTGPDSDFEIGSISKGVTGLLYADALARGEIGPDTTLGALLPLDGAAAAAVTLSSLSTHRSGLPTLAPSAHSWRRTVALWWRGANPYGENLAQLLDQARSVRLGRPVPRYSNLGFELLGHALARAADTTYADLLHRRVAAPLGLEHCSVPASADHLRPGALTGTSRRGRPVEPWT